MSLLFRPSVPLYYEFVHGRKDPYPAYLICGEDAQGYCLGEYNLLVLVPSKEILIDPILEPLMFTALYDFDCLSFYSRINPKVQVAGAIHHPVAKGETVQLDLFSSDLRAPFPYEVDLHKVLSI